VSSVTHDTAVGAQGAKVRIYINESSVNVGANTSQVQVIGTLVGGNSNSGASGFDNISCSITGTAGFVGAAFGFPAGIAAHGLFVFINHTFTITHASDGTKSVTFSVNYSDTGTSMFGAEQGSQATLTLTKFGSKPSAPGAPAATNILPTSMTLTWAPPDDNGGFAITSYTLRQYLGSDISDEIAEYTIFGTTVNLTGLKAGTTYTFTVLAYNGPGAGSGYSDPSSEATWETLAGAWMRVESVWVVAIPYVRSGGSWRMAVPWIRVAGVWKETH
jgi:hypothetical protein